MKFPKLMGSRLKYFWIPIVISVWTILQSVAHAWWIIYGREIIACSIKVKRRVEFYVYLTYFYGNNCDKHALNEYAIINFNIKTQTRIMDIPSMYKEDGTMTELLMNFYLGFDAFWIVCSVALLVGIIMRLKQWSVILFYTPWIFTAITLTAMDLFSSLYFAFKTSNAEIVETALPWNLPISAIMAIISGRLGLIWVANIVNIFYICWITRFMFKLRYADEKNTNSPQLQKMRRQDTENRIKSWQQFYGGPEDDMDYAITFKELEDYNQKRRRSISGTEPELCSTFKSSSSVNSENAPVSANNCSKKKVQINELSNHLPWSYTDGGKKLTTSQEEEGTRIRKVTVVEPRIRRTNSLNNEAISKF